MKEIFRKYAEYNEINYDYIDKIPVGWELLPNIALFDERIQRNNIDQQLLSVTITKGVILQDDIENKKDSSNEDKTSYKLVKSGDIVYNKMRMWQGSIGYSKYTGIVSPAYVVLKPKLEMDPRYFHYLFRSSFYVNYSKRFSYGLCDDQLNLRYREFKRMYSIVPPYEIQKLIADKLSGIDELLELKVKEIEKIFGRKIVQLSEFIPNNFYDYVVFQLVTGQADVHSITNEVLYQFL
jgi:type I restriction enzyme S subunit